MAALSDLVPDDGEDGNNFDVYLNPADVEAFKARWCGGQMQEHRRSDEGLAGILQTIVDRLRDGI